MKTNIILVFGCFLIVSKVYGQYFSHYHEWSEQAQIDYATQLIVSNDTMYIWGKRYKGTDLIAYITMMTTEGEVLKTRDINWAWALSEPNSMIKDGNRIFYFQSDDRNLQAPFANGIQLLELNSELDSISYNYYPNDIENWYIYTNAMIPYKDHYVLGFSSVLGSNFDHTNRLFWLNKSDLSLDTITQWSGHNSFVKDFGVRGDRLMVGYYAGDEDGFTPTQDNRIKFINEDKRTTFDWRSRVKDADDFTFLFAQNGDIIFVHSQRTTYPTFKRIDSIGRTVWEETRDLSSIDDIIYNSVFVSEMIETKEGDILICGRIRTDLNNVGLTDSVKMYETGLLMKLDGETGKVIWERYLVDFNDNGPTIGYQVYDIKELEDGNIIGVGRAYPYAYWRDHLSLASDIELWPNWDADTWIFKVDSEGCFKALPCDNGFESYVSNTKEIYNNIENIISVYPNPASEYISIDYTELDISNLQIEIYNSNGMKVSEQQMNTYKNQIDISELDSGYYFIMMNYRKASQWYQEIEKLSIIK